MCLRGSDGRVLGPLLLALVLAAAGVAAGVRWHAEIAQRVPVKWLTKDAAAARPSEKGEAARELYTCGMHPQVIQAGPGTCPICGMQLTPVRSTPSATGAAPGSGGERKIKYWWDPMLSPPYISDQPGKSPMGMDLIPVYEDEVAAGPTVVIDPTVVQNMGVRTAVVVEAPLVRSLRFYGMLAEPEPDHVDVNLRVSGWIEKLFASVDGMPVEQGEPLFELYSPDLNVAVEEMISARRSLAAATEQTPASVRETAQTLFDTARRKLELFGIDEAQIERLAALDAGPRTVTFTSPMTGHVTKKMVYEGAAVEAGELAMRIASRARMWLDLRVQEQDLPYLALGQRVTTKVDAVPDREFAGEIVFFHPHLDLMTRTALARVQVGNDDLLLREGMYAIADVEVEALPRALQVPREAVIDTGTRQVAFVALEAGHFEPRIVRMGLPGSDGAVQVLHGLAPGEKVVTSGQFLLDAESRLREAVQKYLRQKLAETGPGGAEERPAAGDEMEHPPGGEHAGHASPPRQPEDASPPRGETDASRAAETEAIAEPVVATKEWQASVDAALGAYLMLARELGAPGEEAVELDLTKLADASKQLATQAEGADAKKLASELESAVGVLRDTRPGRRRDAFKRVSEAAVALASRSPPSRAVAPRLFVVHCPMSNASWLQAVETVANPFFAREMKQCGTVERAIQATDR